MAPVLPAAVSPLRRVPSDITRPPYVGRPGPEPYAGPHVQSPETIERMRVAGRVAAQAMQAGADVIAPGVTTDEVDSAVHEFLLDHHAYPSTLGYRGFPKSCCTSVNEVICHGIPDARPLEDGDLVKIDVTAYLDGVHGDNCGTYFCGEVDEASRLLTERTREALDRAVKAVKPGRRVNVLGRVIESYARRFGYGVVRDYTGHGVHTAFHSGLVIPHYDAPEYDTEIAVGMTFTIEPMITLGTGDWYMWDDDWTVLTADGSRCAQFEHTLVVTESGAEVLTLPDWLNSVGGVEPGRGTDAGLVLRAFALRDVVPAPISPRLPIVPDPAEHDPLPARRRRRCIFCDEGLLDRGAPEKRPLGTFRIRSVGIYFE